MMPIDELARQFAFNHGIVCDVENAGAEVVYADDGTANLVIDGNLITGKHPEGVDAFMAAFVDEIEKK